MISHFQVGGSLVHNAPSYVIRQADMKLYRALRESEFCYILNSRQMGKSSLLVQTKYRLQQENVKCAVLDMTRIGSENMSSREWYQGIIAELWRGFELFDKVDINPWLQEDDQVSNAQRLSYFIEDVLLTTLPQTQIVIFIDEIDSILGLNFSVDDFFALIRFCFNQRAENPEYTRLSFAIFGVATPSNLIQDRYRTPFNIARAIFLNGFTLSEAKVFIKGLELIGGNAQLILQEILAWTGGQPFLTQKLCQLAVSASYNTISETLTIPAGTEKYWVETLVRSQLIHHWESQDEPEHLRTVRDRILQNQAGAGRVLGLYQTILQGIEIETDDSQEQVELRLSGLVYRDKGRLKIRNRIYQEVFNQQWVQQQLDQLRPYSQSFEAWMASDQTDQSRLLRGQALTDAQQWAHGKRLSDLDYQFLAAGQTLERQEIQKTLELERSQQVQALLAEEQKRRSEQQKYGQRQRQLLRIISGAFVIACGLGLTALFQSREAALSEIRAIATSAKSLFLSHQQLDALIEGMRAHHKLSQAWGGNPETRHQVQSSLQHILFNITEANRMKSHTAEVYAVAYHPDGDIIASASEDKTVKLWSPAGKLLNTLTGHDDWIYDVAFSPDGQLIASASGDKTIKVWNLEGQLIRTLEAHQNWVHSVAFSPDSQLIASGSADDTLKLWTLDGTVIRTFEGHDNDINRVVFSPDGQMIASSSEDKTVRLWNLNGKLLNTFSSHTKWVHGIAFHPDGKLLASAGGDRTIQVWDLDGNLLQTLAGHAEGIWEIAFSSDGQILGSASGDNTIKLWNTDGQLLQTFHGHQATVFGVTFSPDTQTLVSTSADNTLRTWSLSHPILTHLRGHQAEVWGVGFRPDGKQLATASWDFTVKIWTAQGTLQTTLEGHQNWVNSVAFSPDNRIIATASEDNTVRLWSTTGAFIRSLLHDAEIYQVIFSPNNKTLVSVGNERRIKIWSPNGTLLQSLEGDSHEWYDATFSPDGKILATSGEGIIQLWNVDPQGRIEAHPYQTLRGHKTEVWKLAFSPDGQTLASASGDHSIKLWSRDGSLRHTLKQHADEVNGIAFSPDGKIFASASNDNTIKLWNQDGTLVTTLEGHGAPVWAVAFSPNGKHLVSSSENKTVILWNLNDVIEFQSVLIQSCHWLNNYLRNGDGIPPSDQQLCDKLIQ